MESVEQRILQRHLAQFLVSDVFNTITDEDILKIKAPNVWFHKGAELTSSQVNALRGEAQAILSTQTWKILMNELRWHAQKRTLEKSQTEQDLIAAKLLTYLTDILESRLEKMAAI